MGREQQRCMLMVRILRKAFSGRLPVPTVVGTGIVLLFMIAISGAVQAQDPNGINVGVFEFTSDFFMPMARGRLDGLMASDGSQHRIAIYWLEPALFRDGTFSLRYSDFIFSKNRVYYWLYGESGLGTFDLSDSSTDGLLPQRGSMESVVRSALAVLGRIKCRPRQMETSLEVGKFFRQSRGRAEYAYKVLPDQADSNNQSSDTASVVQIMNALPYGRKYSKARLSDGTLVWAAQRASNGRPVVGVMVRPVSGAQTDDVGSIFDPETLGQWKLIPEPYRTYWSFDRAYSELKDAPERSGSNGLYDKVDSYLDNNQMPAKVRMALSQLRFKVAIMTGDTHRVRLSAQSVVTKLCQDDSVSKYQSLLELARIAGKIHEQYPQQTDELVRPFVRQVLGSVGNEAPVHIERLLDTINRNNWFTYGNLLLEEVRSQSLAEEDIVDTLAARLEAPRLAREKLPSEARESTATVKKYLAQLDADPPKGTITIDDVRHILEKGLAKCYTDDESELKRKLAEDVIQSIRMIVREGPFRGNREKLIKSIERFSWLYLVVNKTREPIDTVLATFLALSFCDISTPEDHDVLFSQMHKLSTELQSQLNTMLSERGLSTLVTPSDVEGVLLRYEQKFRQYIDDPLWPAFKFPLTANEQTRLANKLKVHFERVELEPLFDEVSLKLKYAGGSAELKQKALDGISRAAEALIPETAFLRSPPYPGVSCRYQGRYGFTVVIKGPLYRNGNRPKEKFKTMKYFHMGHRLEDIVKRERELTSPH